MGQVGQRGQHRHQLERPRGAIIDEARLIEALERRQIGGAGLDVFTQEPLADTSPLRRLRNVVLTPRQGRHVEESYQIAFADVVENITAFLKGSPIRILAPERNLTWIHGNERRA